MLTTNQEIFKEGFPGESKPRYLIKNDGKDLQLFLDLHIDIRIDETKKSIRHIYSSFVAKFSFEEDYENKQFIHRVKFNSLAIDKLRVFSLDPLREEPNESALFHSAIGL